MLKVSIAKKLKLFYDRKSFQSLRIVCRQHLIEVLLRRAACCNPRESHWRRCYLEFAIGHSITVSLVSSNCLDKCSRAIRNASSQTPSIERTRPSSALCPIESDEQ